MAYQKWSIACLYATLVKENIPPGYRTLVFVMRATGIWPTADDSPHYKWLTIAFAIFVGILFPLTIFINVFFVNSIEDAMDYLFTSLTCWASVFKAGVIIWRRHNIRDLFEIHSTLLRVDGRNPKLDEAMARTNYRTHIIITSLYMSTWFSALFQLINGKPENGDWQSTLQWPYELAKRRPVFLAVLVEQVVFSMGIILWAGLEDSMSIALINTICGHTRQLKARLRALGTVMGANGSGQHDSLFYAELKDSCQFYEGCLSFIEMITKALSLAFFVQFGVSALVLCFSVYVLSMNNPMDNLPKFLYIIVYLTCIVSQIFVNCYLGSRLSGECDDITHAIYESNWIGRNAKCQRAMRILVERSIRPTFIVAGGLVDLSLLTFVRICRAAYSVFNLLRNVA